VSADFNNVQAVKEWLPSLLTKFMENVVCSETKNVAISHSIVQAARPRLVISPVLLEVGVSLDHAFGSKWLLESLSRLGFSISHDEVNLYKPSVVLNENLNSPESFPLSFTQWSGDNVDHNVVNIDGSGTFHGIGIISMSAPCDKLKDGKFLEIAIPQSKRVNVLNLVKNRSIPIIPYCLPDKYSLSQLHFKPIAHLHFVYKTSHKVNGFHGGTICDTLNYMRYTQYIIRLHRTSLKHVKNGCPQLQLRMQLCTTFTEFISRLSNGTL